jgi:hypothetical protein
MNHRLNPTRDAHISPRAEGPRANMGRGLIWHVTWKMPYHNLFIIYFRMFHLHIYKHKLSVLNTCMQKKLLIECFFFLFCRN